MCIWKVFTANITLTRLEDNTGGANDHDIQPFERRMHSISRRKKGGVELRCFDIITITLPPNAPFISPSLLSLLNHSCVMMYVWKVFTANVTLTRLEDNAGGANDHHIQPFERRRHSTSEKRRWRQKRGEKKDSHPHPTSQHASSPPSISKKPSPLHLSHLPSLPPSPHSTKEKPPPFLLIPNNTVRGVASAKPRLTQ